MCIRDSLEGGRVGERLERGTRLPQRHHAINGAAMVLIEVVARSFPVSYTHLRAHETVLDLVCRLLLEKHKNLNHTYTHTLTQRTTHSDMHPTCNQI